jgi:peptidoglycan-N-acetylglucosamine deacetylase
VLSLRRLAVAGPLIAGLLCIGSGSGSAATATTGSQPLSVQSASLSQNALQFVWRLNMSQPFSPGALARDRRTLCLLVDRAGNGAVSGQLCLAGPRQGDHTPQLTFASVSNGTAGQARVVRVTVTRASNRELTASFLPGVIGAGYKPLRWQVVSTLSAPACSGPAIHSAPTRSCQSLFPARPALLTARTPRLVGCVANGAFVSRGPSNAREVALTFDDGPGGTPPTRDFVNLLARYGVPATFFEIGNQIRQYDPTGAVQREMLADGDMIGDHSWSHPDLAKMAASAARSQIASTAAAIKQATGFQPCLFRAPYGSVSSSVISTAKSLGFSTIQWDVDTRDWSLPGTGTIVGRVLSGVRNGSIVLQHNGGGPRYQTLAALPAEITGLKARGYKFVTLTQMLGYKLIYK